MVYVYKYMKIKGCFQKPFGFGKGSQREIRNLIMMKCFFVIPVVFVMLFSCRATQTGGTGLKVREYDYGYEKMVFDNYRFEFKFHLSALEGDQRIERIIKSLIYDGNGPEAYVTYKEETVLEGIRKDNRPPQPGEEGEYINQGEYLECVEIKNYGDSFAILRRDDYAYYSGQAHGISRIQYYIVDLDEEEILPLDGLASAIPDDILKENIASKFDIDFNYRESLWPPDTISLEREGMLLLWNVYSIAPYSDGPIEITIPYGLASAYLTEKARLIRDKLTAE
jgi:hypothetical protein